MQTAITLLLVAAALFFVGRRLWRSMHGSKSSSGGGCSNCESGSAHASDWAH